MSSAGAIGLVSGVVYCASYVAAILALRRIQPDGWSDALFSLGLMGVIFPLLTLALTRGLRPPQLPPAGRALLPLTAYMAVFAVLVLGFGLSWIQKTVSAEPGRSVAILALKLITMVAVPAAILAASTGALSPWISPRWYSGRLWIPLLGLGIPMLLFQAVLGRGLKTMAAMGPTPGMLAWVIPACFLWLIVDVGLPEELLFRVAAQGAIADRLRSPIAGVLLGALLFGLAHAPGLYLRGASAFEGLEGRPSIGWAVAYSIAVISPPGILFGTLWARTRSLSLVILLHATMDLIPNLAVFLKMIR